MKFLVDVCAGQTVANWLIQEKYDVSVVWKRDSKMSDLDVLAWVYQENRILVTMDKDFGRLIFRDKSPHSGVIRLPNVSPQKRLSLLEIVLKRHTKDLDKSSIVTVQRDRIRVTRAILK